MDDLLNPVPLPPEVAVDEPPLSDHVIELVMAGVVKAHTSAAAEEIDFGHETEEERERRLAATAAATEVVQRWEITDESGAEWAAGRLTEMIDRIADVDREHAGYVRRLTTWREKRLAPLERFRGLLEAKLLEYGRARREATKNTKQPIKSIALPSATISSRGATKGTYEITDEPALIAFLEEHVTDEEVLGAVVKVKKSILKGGLLGALKADKDHALFDEDTGKMAPGIIYNPPTTTYEVKPR